MASMSFRSTFTVPPRAAAKNAPPEETYRESEYLRALGERQKSVTIKLIDGETVRGWVEYFDQHMIRLTREGEPNLFIFKEKIAYIAEDKRPANMAARRGTS